jgi:hypothetical protein
MKTKIEKSQDPRYPYTYSCDLIRTAIPCREGGFILDRSDASTIIQLFSKVLKIDETELARNLADYYLDNKEEINKLTVDFIKKMLKV